MRRTLAVVSGVAIVALVAYGCSSVVSLTPGHFPAQPDTGEVQIIDARTMDRTGIERVLAEHYLIGRFDATIPRGDDYEQRLLEEVEKGKTRALRSGGRTLMYTDDSELIAVMKQDARFAGASDAITMYVLLRRR